MVCPPPHTGLTGIRGLEEVIAQVARDAAHAIPGADGAGVTVLQVDRPQDGVAAVAASNPLVALIDQIQCVRVNEGPCFTAALERRPVRAGSLGGESRWPQFGPRVGRLGIHSALSLPLLLPGQVVGAITVYARGKDVFDDHAQELGELFAAPAAVAVHNARALSQAIALTAQLQTALANWPLIDEAIGLIRSRTGASSVQALGRLERMSQHEHVTTFNVAQHLVNEAAHRARAHYTDS